MAPQEILGYRTPPDQTNDPRDPLESVIFHHPSFILKLSRYLPGFILAALGALAAIFLAPAEMDRVRDHLVGFPDSDRTAHQLRPIVLAAICFIPAIGGFYYSFCKKIDRYLIRQFMGALTLCFTAIYSIWFISDLADNIGEFRNHQNPLAMMGQYYLIALPWIILKFAPFSLLLAMLYSLGKLSKAQEITSIIQTGRGTFRLIYPLLIIGGLIGLLCLGLNYHWAPHAEGYNEALVEEQRKGTLSEAENVLFFEPDHQRLWIIGSFPYNYHHGEPLKDVIVRSFSKDGQPLERLQAKTASWNPETQHWTFSGTSRTNVGKKFNSLGISATRPKPDLDVPDPLIITNWSETPWKLIKPGLKAEQLGIPGLYSWLQQNRNTTWALKRRFVTQWHDRWARPGICLAIVMLAAPLGIVFTRRGAAGGIVLAIFLCVAILFSSRIFLALGESGYLNPCLAAWGTNILATFVALVLIQRRLVGRPIYQTLRRLIPR